MMKPERASPDRDFSDWMSISQAVSGMVESVSL
jgi:hypothetical protein